VNEKLFRPIIINRTRIKNRFAFAAAADHMDKLPDRRIKRFSDLAAGGVGMIISGATTFTDKTNWQQIILAVHANGGNITPQILPQRINDALVSVLPTENKYFSPLIFPYRKHRAYDDTDIANFISQYAASARTAKALGADGVEVHAAHHSIPATFLSPYTNTRTDKWGGSLENRIRFHKEVYTAIRGAVGADFPIIIKLGVQDMTPDGLKYEEGKLAAIMLAEHGYDAIEVSQGLQYAELNENLDGLPLRSHILRPEQEAYFRDWSRGVKAAITKPVILTGGIFSFEVAKSIVESGDADMISLCRALIREPGLINRWQQGDVRRATCTACNKCTLELLAKGQPLECFLDMHKL